MTRSFTGTLLLQLIWLTAVLALFRFVVENCGPLIHQVTDLPDALAQLPALQLRLAPFADRATLVASSILLVLLIPKLAADRPKKRLLRFDMMLALLALSLLGALAVNALIHAAWSLRLAGAILMLLCLTGALRLTLSHLPLRSRFCLAVLLIASVLPLAWRELFESGESFDSALLKKVRESADAGLLIAWALMAAAIGKPTRPWLMAIPLFAATAVLGLAEFAGDRYTELLQAVSGLWYTALPHTWVVILSAFGALALTGHAVSKDNGLITVGLLFFAASAHQPGKIASLVLQALAIVLLVAGGVSKQGRGAQLNRLLR